jgi:hypothetical protein
MGAARICGRCGASVVGHAEDQAPDRKPVPRKPTKLDRVTVVFIVVFLDVFMLGLAGIAIWGYLIQGSPAEAGTDYMPLWGAGLLASGFASLPVVSVVLGIRRLRRSARERRAVVSDTPVPTQEGSESLNARSMKALD